ncbi:MAG: protein RarD [Naasia sp.]|nr:protein RarD [Naasia sp.]
MASRSPSPRSDAEAATGLGLLYALGAYALWGVLPLYFLVLAPAGPVEIVAWRVLFSLVFCAILLTMTRSWRSVPPVFRSPRTALLTALASVLIAVNWLVYVLAAFSGHVVEAALGYFINPVVTIFLGVLVLRERLRPMQWASIGVSLVAIVVLAVGYGSVPWIALALAFSFGLYGLLKNRLGGTVDAVTGLTVETAWLAVPAAITVAVLAGTTGIAFGSALPVSLLLAAAGIVTAVPLLFFAGAARRLPLTLLGFMQYLAPITQLIIGVAVLGEPMPLERWIGFGLVWLALAILSTDALRRNRAARTERALEPAEPI